MLPFGNYKRDVKLSKLDNRTREGKVMAQLKHRLRQQLGSNLTMQQELLIDRAAKFKLRVAILDDKMLNDSVSAEDAAAYLAFTDGLKKTLDELGVGAVEEAA